MLARPLAVFVVTIAGQCGAPEGFVFVLAVHDDTGGAVVTADGVEAELESASVRNLIVRREFSSYAGALAAAPITVEAWRNGKLSDAIQIQPGEACHVECMAASCGELVGEQRGDVRVRSDGTLDLGAFGCLVCSEAGAAHESCP